MLRSITPLVAALLGAVAIGQSAPAQITTVPTPVVYRLSPVASYQQGCFPPCLCPATITGQVRGTMLLTTIISGIDVIEQHVSDVNWLVARGNATPEIRITGSGVLHHVGPTTSAPQRLELDLVINGAAPQHFDSGWVPGSWPAIDITISLNNQVCHDTVIRVAAAPVPNSQLLRYRVNAGSTYQTGCFPPCMCPLIAPLPLTGSFTLVPMLSPVATPTSPSEYAVVSARLIVNGPTVTPVAATSLTPTSIPVIGRFAFRGFGFYRRNLAGPWASMLPGQRLLLDLRRSNADPLTRFDSGLTPVHAAWPAIDVTISMNNMVCYDTVFHIKASPVNATTP